MPRTVTILRRAGKLNEALETARSALAISPGDPWAVSDLGWTLYDLVKKAQQDNDNVAAQAWLGELLAIPIGDEEPLALLKGKRESLIRYVHPTFIDAKERCERGDHLGALESFRTMLGGPQTAKAELSIGWELYHLLKSLPEKHDGQVNIAALSYLRDYCRLDIATPDKRDRMLHRCILIAACRFATDLGEFGSFIRWWDLSALDEEDAKPYESEGGSWSSLVEKALGAVCRYLKKHPAERDRFVGLADLLQRFENLVPVDEWWNYHYGRLLCWVGGEHETARQHLYRLLPVKWNQFWMWDALAETFDDPNLKAACWSKALLCRTPKRQFLVGVLEDLTKQFLLEKKHQAASKLLEECIALRTAEGWSVPPDLDAMARMEWYSPDAIAQEELRTLLVSRAAELVPVLPLEEVPVTCARLLKESEGKPALLHCYTADQRHVAGPLDFPPTSQPAPGSPWTLWIIREKDRIAIVDMKPRAGSAWEFAPLVRGVITEVNRTKNLVVAHVGRPELAIVHGDRFPIVEDLNVGDYVRILYREDERGDRAKLRIDHLTPDDSIEPPEFVRTAVGTFTRARDKEFGFIRTGDDIFIAPSEARGLEHGQQYSVVAVKTDRGWRGVRFEPK